MEHVALFREELGTGVRVLVTTTARFMVLSGLRLLEGPERVRVFGFEVARVGTGHLAPFSQFAGTFHGRYFQELVRMQAVPVVQFAVSFAPLYPDDTIASRMKFAATLQVEMPKREHIDRRLSETQKPEDLEPLAEAVVDYSRLIRVGDSYVPVVP